MVKGVSFKDKSENDIIEYLIENGYLKCFSYYVKGLIKKDMDNKLTTDKKEVVKKRNTNFEL